MMGQQGFLAAYLIVSRWETTIITFRYMIISDKGNELII